MKTLLSAVLFISLLFSSSCKSENPYTIPYVPVNFYVYPNGIDSDLGVSRFKYFTQVGFRGIVVYRIGSDQFLAYDRACTFDTQNTKAIVAVDPSGLMAVCPVCGSKYLLTDGYPFQGPAKNPLLQYNTTYDGFKVYVSN
jgi:nitrite reductase/ring-hydroxylating ferredoxin subunit